MLFVSSLSAQAQDISNPVQYFYEQLKAEEQRKEDSIRKAQEDSRAMLKQMLLQQHPKGCGCATRLHRALNNMVNNSGVLKADTTRYFFQFGRVFKQIGGHEPPQKEGKQ